MRLLLSPLCSDSPHVAGPRTTTRDDSDHQQRTFGGQEGGGKDPEAQGPAPEVEGAVEGGTITVFLPSDPGPDTLDPTGGWSVTGNSIQQELTNRSLTQYLIGDDGAIVLVPDLATDLGTPNEDYTEWTFTIRDDATWETGDPVTAEEVAFGITRSLDSDDVPVGSRHRVLHDVLPRRRQVQGSLHRQGQGLRRRHLRRRRQHGHHQDVQAVPRHGLLGLLHGDGPGSAGRHLQPAGLRQGPAGHRPVQGRVSFRPGEELVLVKNDQWDPDSDPARHQYADGFVFKFNQDQAQVDEIMLSGNTESQTAVSTGRRLGQLHQGRLDPG